MSVIVVIACFVEAGWMIVAFLLLAQAVTMMQPFLFMGATQIQMMVCTLFLNS